MTDDSGSGSNELYNEILQGLKAKNEVAVAIQQGLKNIVETADTEIQKLIQTNLVPPDVSAEMQKMQEAMIKKTIEIINNSPSGFPPDGSSNDGSDG